MGNTITLRLPRFGDRYGPSNGKRKGLRLDDDEKERRQALGQNMTELCGLPAKERKYQTIEFWYVGDDGARVDICWCHPGEVSDDNKKPDMAYALSHTIPDTPDTRERIKGNLRAGKLLVVGDVVPGYGVISPHTGLIPEEEMSPPATPSAGRSNGRTPPPPPPGK